MVDIIIIITLINTIKTTIIIVINVSKNIYCTNWCIVLMSNNAPKRSLSIFKWLGSTIHKVKLYFQTSKNRLFVIKTVNEL